MNIVIYGFCRGMQVIDDYFGTDLIKVENHVAVRHRLEGNSQWNGRTVNETVSIPQLSWGNNRCKWR